jgi:ribosomal protein L14E/L6E/L27E|nr:hypothetical protein [Clostridia bacterium]
MMRPVEIGNICRSIQGHDRDRLYIVTGLKNDGMAELADGLFKKVDAPKLKNVKHIEVLERNVVFKDKYGETPRDEDIRYELNSFVRIRDYQGD